MSVPLFGFEALYHNNGLLVVNKAPGLTTDQWDVGPFSLIQLVQAQYPGYRNCHRIDKNTSGLILYALSKNERGGSPFGYIMQNWHKITRKTYLAVIKKPDWINTTVDLPLQSEEGVPFKTARTDFEVIYTSGGYSIVQCVLVNSGRKHQIRKHLQSIGSPIVGDYQYGGKRIDEREGQLLHAWKLRLEYDSHTHYFEAPIDRDFKDFFKHRQTSVDWQEIVRKK